MGYPSHTVDTLSDLVSYYLHAIKQKRPSGPYRIATFSISSVIGVALVKELERQGDTVLQLTFIDHFPAIWLSPAFRPYDNDIIKGSEGGDLSPRLVKAMTDHIMTMLQNDNSLFAHELVAHDPLADSTLWLEDLVQLVVKFVSEFGEDGGLVRWLATLQAPM